MRQEIEAVKKYVRAANYISAGQLYLQDNFTLKRALKHDDIKPILLGHWGTCPGINFVYAHLNYLIRKRRAKMLFVLGPGHGFPALQANLFIEGTLAAYYPDATLSSAGLGYIMKNFSRPYGFPSHSSPGAPGVILEGGELGYALSTSYGAALDNPDLIVACLIGDGEAETGATAAAWHLSKFISPKTNGAVLPILHLNGYKISGPTIFGRMSNRELKSLFFGYGYTPYIVEGANIYEKMANTLEKCHDEIRRIQREARDASTPIAPRFPMIILKTPKGWTGIRKLGGNKIEGNCLAHQITAPNAKVDAKELRAVEKWMRSYKFHELFSEENGFIEEIKNCVPEPALRMGQNKRAFGGRRAVKELLLPAMEQFIENVDSPGVIGSSSMRRAGLFLKEVALLNKDAANFRFFSPDETYSNKLDAIFSATPRGFVWPIKKWDKDINPEGRVIEMLSEHSLQGLMQGFVLTGRHAVFASYEAFIQIVSSMTDQYSKFLRVARETPWRGPVPSLNYILTSSGWRQEHNGFSHQNPGFIDTLLQKHGCFVHVYFPPDSVSTLAVLARCLASRNEINVIVAGKTLEPVWLTPELARKQLERGIMIWDFPSDPHPDIVLSAAGDYLTKETLAAISIVKTEAPEIRMRFVSILELSALGVGNADCRAPLHNFADYFTENKPVIFNFHGYPETLKQALFDIPGDTHRFSVHGYREHGSTTTPFDMHIRNGTSRWHLVIEVCEKMAKAGVISPQKAADLIEKYNQKFADHKKYIIAHGIDPEEIDQWQWIR